MSRWVRIWWAVAGVAVLSVLLLCPVTMSGSLPRGLYLRIPRSWRERRPVAGDLVLACAPTEGAALARRRGYLGSGRCSAGGAEPIGKVVLAAEGDEIVMGDDGIAVNGRRIPNS